MRTTTEFPFFIQEKGRKPQELVEIRRRDGAAEDALFYIYDGYFVAYLHENAGVIDLLHSRATDSSGLCSKVAEFDLSAIKRINESHEVYKWTATLYSVRMYKDATPFDGVKWNAPEKKDPQFGRWANTGFPYTPKDVTFDTITLPLEVEVRVIIGARKVRSYLRRAKAAHRKASKRAAKLQKLVRAA